MTSMQVKSIRSGIEIFFHEEHNFYYAQIMITSLIYHGYPLLRN